MGEIAINKEISDLVLNTLGDSIATGVQILAASQQKGLNERDVVTCILLLVNAGSISPAYPAGPNDAGPAVRRINQTIMQMTAAADTHRFLASSATGSAISANFLDRIIGLAEFGPDGPSDADLAGQAFDSLAAEGQSFRRDGKPVSKSDAEIATIAEAVKDFRLQRLPRWRALGII